MKKCTQSPITFFLACVAAVFIATNLFASGGSGAGIADSVGRTLVAGQIAAGTTFSGNPLGTGGRADTTEATVVTDGQTVNAFFSPSGKTVVSPYASKGLTASLGQSTSASGDLTLVAADATFKICLTSIAISKDSAVTASTYNITDGAGGTVIWKARHNAAVNAPVAYTFPTPVCGSTNTALVVNSSAAVDTYYGYTYFKTAD